MGYDAYNLIASLYGVRGGQMAELDGATGQLFLDVNGRLHRRLAWAQFQNGEAVALPKPVEADGPIDDLSEEGEILAPEAEDDKVWDGVRTEL